MSRVSVVIVLYNANKLIPSLISTLEALPEDIEVFAYDSGSSDDSVQMFKEGFSRATITMGENLGFGHGNNRSLDLVTTEYVLFLNSDASIDTDSLQRLVQFLDENPTYAAVQPLIRLWGYDLVTASAGVYFTDYGEAYDGDFMHMALSTSAPISDIPGVTAALSLFRTKALKSVGGFDESYFMYFEDADLCLRLSAEGWKFALLNDATGVHQVGASSTRKQAKEWELSSSIRLYRTFFGNGKLTTFWWKRELRILLHSIFNGQIPFWRIKLHIRALFYQVDAIKLPETYKATMYGNPLNKPYAHPSITTNTLSVSGSSEIAAPWIALHKDRETISINLKSQSNSLTGAILSEDGDLLQRFCVSPNKSHTVQLACRSKIVYIRCDCSTSKLEVKVL